MNKYPKHPFTAQFSLKLMDTYTRKENTPDATVNEENEDTEDEEDENESIDGKQ